MVGRFLIFFLLFPFSVHAAATATALSHNGTAIVTVNENEPCFFYAKDSVGGTGADYLSLRDFEWDFGEHGSVVYGDSISSFTYHKYTTAGEYTVTLRVTDDENNTDTDTITVTVQAVPAGDTFYVTKAGSDANDCTDNTTNACLTIEGALAKETVAEGDTIIVGAGSYAESITMQKSGTANNPITVKAADGTTPEIYSEEAAGERLLNFNGHDYITFDGFEFDGRSIADAVYIPPNSVHCSIRNSEIHHVANTSYAATLKRNNGLSLSTVRENPHTDAPATWAYIYNTSIHNNNSCNVNVSTWGNVFEEVDVYDPGLATPGEDNYVINSAGHGNYFKGGSNTRSWSTQEAHRDAWELYGASNVTIDGMEINNAEAELIMCDAAIRPLTDMCDNFVFVNNIVYRSYASDQQQLKLRCGWRFKVLNNTFYGRLDPIVLDTCQNATAPSDHGISANNIFMGNGSYSCSNQYESYDVEKTNNHYYNCSVAAGEVGYLTSDPALTDPDTDGTGDFTLTVSSPGIDQGINIGYPVDYAGTTRDTYDIGAYEYSAAGPVRTNGSPAGSIANTATVTLTLNTDVNATCKHDDTPGTAYASMSNTFGTTGTTAHSDAGVAVSEGENTFYVRCSDGTANTTDYAITFTVLDTEAPIRSEGWPYGTVGYATSLTIYTEALASSCRYTTTPDTLYENMVEEFDSTPPGWSKVVAVDVGENNFYARCTDGVNTNTTDYIISFIVSAPVVSEYPNITVGGTGSITIGGTGSITLGE